MKAREAKEANKRALKQMEMEKRKAADAARRSGSRSGSLLSGMQSPTGMGGGMTTEAPSFAPPSSRSIGNPNTGSSAGISPHVAGHSINIQTSVKSGMKLGGKKVAGGGSRDMN